MCVCFIFKRHSVLWWNNNNWSLEKKHNSDDFHCWSTPEEIIWSFVMISCLLQWCLLWIFSSLGFSVLGFGKSYGPAVRCIQLFRSAGLHGHGQVLQGISKVCSLLFSGCLHSGVLRSSLHQSMSLSVHFLAIHTCIYTYMYTYTCMYVCVLPFLPFLQTMNLWLKIKIEFIFLF